MEPIESPALPPGDHDVWAASDQHGLCWEIIDLLANLYDRYPDDEDLIFARLSRVEYRVQEAANEWAERLDEVREVEVGGVDCD